MRRLSLGMLIFVAGCQSLAPGVKRFDSAEALWLEGQQAMRRGETDQAVALYQKSLEENGRLAQNHLSLAAAFLEQGADEQANVHLTEFLAAHPEHAQVRFYRAELLLRMGKLDDAGREYETAIAQRQDDAGDVGQLLQCHCRLFEIGQKRDDAYTAHLHRGIGLYLLAQVRARVTASDAEVSAEALLCKAAAELSEAQQLQPVQARASWYLHRVWHDLAQPHQAGKWLRETQVNAPFSYLTPAESRSLEIASRTETRGAK